MKIFPWIVAAFFAVLFVLSLLSIHQNKDKLNKTNNITASVRKENDKYRKVIGYFYQNEGLKMRDETCINEKGDSIKLSRFIEAFDDAVIFKYTSNNCSVCIDKTFHKISKIDNVKQLIVISDFPNIPAIRSLKNKYKLKNAIFIKSGNTVYPETPSVFITDRTMKISKFLIINQDDNVLDTYLKKL